MNLPRIRRLIIFFMRQARRRDRQRDWEDISLVLTDDAGIARINRLFLEREGITDVISFEGSSVPGRTGRCGELFINVQCAVAEGRKHGGANRELALYMAHGCDHVSGGSDRMPKGRRRMRARELRWLRAAAERHLLNGLLNGI
ncbi:MAG: rRNA maturation RNase YbeY [Verrucomicrobia bacterium]|nr:rRNA maturation RNase YbeY [Verrucomicrobiota bacterium]MBU4292011.1 rRNA maturation RNase YbeY [Verrucomicrobiota bacterium]MBU4427899.1 rRNA maturation RNase YbeY [Verrucomicrobiota bacterium]MCG2678845.1 rRNA maturation RNase YbeY [Kiritimatiellia bacterium]